MFLSIIIPTWRNTEEEIRRCLDSLYVSDLDFEVLLVDDGNEAAYGEMLDTLAAEREHLTVFHLPHGGVSAARNLGAKRSQGDYVLFVDADDVVTRQFWRDAEEIKAKRITGDIIYGMGFNKEGVLNPEHISESFEARPIDEAEQRTLYGYMLGRPSMQKLYYKNDCHLQRGPVARLIRRDFLKRFPFDTSLKIGEDVIWNIDMAKAKPTGWVTDHAWYNVIGNPDSASRGYRKTIIDGYQDFLWALKPYIPADEEPVYGLKIINALREIAHKYYLSEKNPMPWRQKVKEFNAMVHSEPFSCLLKTDAKIGGVKLGIKIALARAGLLLHAYKLKSWLKRGRR